MEIKNFMAPNRVPSCVAALAMLAAILALASAAFAQTETILYNFSQSGTGGWWPGSLIFDTAGNLYGVNIYGGGYPSRALPFGAGSVFQLAPDGSGGYTYNVLYDFQGGADGDYPNYVNFGPDGSLYGVTTSGGLSQACSYGCGTVYKLTPPAAGSGPWTKTVLHYFSGGADGGSPASQLFVDSSGNVYGTTTMGGKPFGAGIFFELSPTQSGTYTKQNLFEFPTGTKGSPGFLMQNPAGGYYGTTQSPGARFEPGSVFQLSQNASGKWQETILHTFDNTTPGGLVLSPSGSLFGTTNETKQCMFCGAVYELTPSGNTWTYSQIATFSGGKAGGAVSDIAVDAAGDIYGTAYEAGPMGHGFVFQLSSSSGVWTETDLHDFDPNVGGDGFYGWSMTLDNSGNIFGSTLYGGTGDIGVLFKLSL